MQKKQNKTNEYKRKKSYKTNLDLSNKKSKCKRTQQQQKLIKQNI